MGDRKLKLLFLCTGNSCRSQMAEGWTRALKGDRIEAFSAGLEIHGLNPRAVQVMAEAGVDISGHKSKTVAELPTRDFDFVVTVCDHAHESCPLFPGKTKVVHVGFDDPPRLALAATTEEEALAHYRRVRDEIKAFVETLPEGLTSRLDRDASPCPTSVAQSTPSGRANPPGETGSKGTRTRLGKDASPYPAAVAKSAPSGRANPPGETGSKGTRTRLGKDASPYPAAVAGSLSPGRANPPGETDQNNETKP